MTAGQRYDTEQKKHATFSSSSSSSSFSVLHQYVDFTTAS